MADHHKKSVRKGKDGERELAEIISRISGAKYRRVPMSGGLHQDFPFDLMKVDGRESVFDGIGIECKNVKSLRVKEWIEQMKVACADAESGVIYNRYFIAFRMEGEWYFILNQPLFEQAFMRLSALLTSRE